MLTTGLVYKEWSGRDWPVWHNRYIFDANTNPGWFTSHPWAEDLRFFERSFHLMEVSHTLAVFKVTDGTATPGPAAAQCIALGNTNPPFPREAVNPCPWNYFVRCQKFPAVGRNSNAMWRGCLNESDVATTQRGGVGLVTRDWFTEAFQTAGLNRPGSILNSWQIERGASTIPTGVTEQVARVQCGGVSLLNAARRKDAKKITKGVQIYRDVYSYTLVYAQKQREYYDQWYLLDIPDYYPVAIRELVLAGIAASIAAASKVTQWSQDFDGAAPGDQNPTYRYMGTEGTEAAAASALKTKADHAQETVNNLIPFGFAGDNYWHRGDVETMWDALSELNALISELSFFDYQNPDQGSSNIQRQGGYIPLNPGEPPPT